MSTEEGNANKKRCSDLNVNRVLPRPVAVTVTSPYDDGDMLQLRLFKWSEDLTFRPCGCLE